MSTFKIKSSLAKFKKWLSIKHLKKTYLFLGSRVIYYLSGSGIAGLLLFLTEAAFALGLQLFLLALGIASPQTVKLPNWLTGLGFYQVIGLVFSIGVFRALLLWFQTYLQMASMEELKYLIRTRILSWAFHAKSVSATQVTSIFNERCNIAAGAIGNFQGLIVKVIAGICILINLFILSPFTTIVTSIAFLCLGLIATQMSRKITNAGSNLKKEWDRTNRGLLNSIKNLLLMQIYGTQSMEEAKAQKSLRTYRDHIMNHFYKAGFNSAIPQIGGIAMICAIALTYRSHYGIAPAALVSYLYLFLRLAQNFSESVHNGSNLLFYWPQFIEIGQWWNQTLSSDEHDPLPVVQKYDFQIKNISQPLGWMIKNVQYSYPATNHSAIKQFNLHLAPGKTLVITGPSGSGKSTILGLMLGILSPQIGEVNILFGETSYPIESVKPILLKNIGYVGAESFLLEGTIYDNIIYGLSTIPTEAEIHEALKLSECDFIYNFPKQLNHKITEQGHGLSAGQKQRLSLARAFLRKPKILFLDEATANLDSKTEMKLVTTLGLSKGKMTIIAATHRSAMLTIADVQLKLDKSDE